MYCNKTVLRILKYPYAPVYKKFTYMSINNTHSQVANESKLLRTRQGSKWCRLLRPVTKKNSVVPITNRSSLTMRKEMSARAGGIEWATRVRWGRRPYRRASRWPWRAACRGRARASCSTPSPCPSCRSHAWSRPARAAELRTTVQDSRLSRVFVVRTIEYNTVQVQAS